MKPIHEFKRRILGGYIVFALLLFGFLVNLFFFNDYLGIKIALFGLPIVYMFARFFILKFERLYLFDNYFVTRSITGVKIVYYDEVSRIKIHKNKNYINSNAYLIEVINKQNESICTMHPSLLRNILNKKSFFSLLKKNNSLFYIERVFTEKITNLNKNQSLIVLSFMTLGISVFTFTLMFIV